jgi:uncharacterized protein YndB with AHSA1/START domain
MKTIHIEVPVDLTAEAVWSAITDPAERRQWFGGEYDLDPTEGGAVRIDLPKDGVHARGVVRTYGPPHIVEHTFVDDAAPDVTSVCRWGVTRTATGSLLTFEQAGVADDRIDELSSTWSRLLGASSPAVAGARVHDTLDGATSLLRSARRVLLISYIGDEVPRALLDAGFEVSCKSGPGRDQWAVAHLDGDALVWESRTTPVSPVDVVHDDVGRFDEHLEVAVELGASTYWFHSARTRPPIPHDNRGTWVPDDISIAQRAATEARGLAYVDEVYIADAARRINRR